MTRFIGVDYGTKRVGLAISDGLGLTARPLAVVSRRELLGKLKAIVEEFDVSRVVVGLPTGLGGAEGASAEGARLMGAEIADALSIRVDYVDERFTSRMAEGVLLEAGMRRRKRRETVDRVAAAIILQTYLDHAQRNSTEHTGVEPTSQDDI